MQNRTITIKTDFLRSEIRNGRVKAGDKLHLDVSRIKKILAWRRKYYVEYETDKVDYYKQYIETPPPYAVELKHKIEEYKVGVCNKCGSEIEWDADEPFCPRGCDQRYDDWGYHTETRQRFVVESSIDDEVKQFIEKALKVKASFADMLFRNMAGGFTPLFEITKIDVELYKARLTGLAVVENPVFEHSDYDDIEVTQKRYDGKYIVAEVYASGFYRFLFRYEGEPDVSIIQKLHEEYMAKEQEEKEKRRKAEEEEERRRKEEEKKWGDPAKVAEAIRKALPEWADGAVVTAKSICDEDCNVYYYIYPVKRSQRGEGYYFSPEWRTMRVEVPERFLEKLADTVVLRDGRTLKVKREKNGDKYVALKPA